MTNSSEIFQELIKLTGALAALSGAFAWWRKGSAEEDEVVSQAADELLGALTDGDMTNKIKDETGIQVRDQVSIEEAEDWHRERTLRSFKQRN